MHELDQLRFAFDRVRSAPDFVPGERIWWIYLRGAVEAVLVRHELEELRAAYNRVKEFPELLPDERARWLDLRAAARKVLEQSGRA